MYLNVNIHTLINLLQNKSFDEVKQLLTNDPYKLIIKEDSDYPNLYMITYVRNKSNMNNPIVSLCRGLILEKNTNKIVCYSFNKSEDSKNGLIGSPIRTEYAYDGTLMRLFYYNGEWIHSTTRNIDSKKSFWNSSKSFYELFRECLNAESNDEPYYDALDKSHCYNFIICHPENRIVVKYDRPSLIHVMTRNMETFEELRELRELSELNDVDLGIKKPERVADDAIFISNLWSDSFPLYEGIMLVDTQYGNRHKVKSELYMKLKELRGNTNDISKRYLELKRDNLVDSYLQYFPEYADIFYVCELDFNNKVREILRLYVNRHIHHSPEEIPNEYKNIIYKLHGQYLKTREKTTYDTVSSFLLSGLSVLKKN